MPPEYPSSRFVTPPRLHFLPFIGDAYRPGNEVLISESHYLWTPTPGSATPATSYDHPALTQDCVAAEAEKAAAGHPSRHWRKVLAMVGATESLGAFLRTRAYFVLVQQPFASKHSCDRPSPSDPVWRTSGLAVLEALAQLQPGVVHVIGKTTWTAGFRPAVEEWVHENDPRLAVREWRVCRHERRVLSGHLVGAPFTASWTYHPAFRGSNAATEAAHVQHCLRA